MKLIQKDLQRIQLHTIWLRKLTAASSRFMRFHATIFKKPITIANVSKKWSSRPFRKVTESCSDLQKTGSLHIAVTKMLPHIFGCGYSNPVQQSLSINGRWISNTKFGFLKASDALAVYQKSSLHTKVCSWGTHLSHKHIWPYKCFPLCILMHENQNKINWENKSTFSNKETHC